MARCPLRAREAQEPRRLTLDTRCPIQPLLRKSVKRKIRYHVGRLPAAVVPLEVAGHRRLTRDSRIPNFSSKFSRKIVKIGFSDSWDQNKIIKFL